MLEVTFFHEEGPSGDSIGDTPKIVICGDSFIAFVDPKMENNGKKGVFAERFWPYASVFLRVCHRDPEHCSRHDHLCLRRPSLSGQKESRPGYGLLLLYTSAAAMDSGEGERIPVQIAAGRNDALRLKMAGFVKPCIQTRPLQHSVPPAP